MNYTAESTATGRLGEETGGEERAKREEAEAERDAKEVPRRALKTISSGLGTSKPKLLSGANSVTAGSMVSRFREGPRLRSP